MSVTKKTVGGGEWKRIINKCLLCKPKDLSSLLKTQNRGGEGEGREREPAA